MDEWQSIPSLKHVAYLTRHLFSSKLRILRAAFFMMLLIMGIGLIGCSPNQGSADTNTFNQGYQNAQSSNWTTGTWGSSQFYIDNQYNMHISSGHLNGRLYDAIGPNNASQIQSITFNGSVKAPQDSSFLLSTSNTGILGMTQLKNIYGLNNMDTSGVTTMNNMFSNDSQLTSLDLSNWNLSNVQDLSFAFWNNASLSYLNLSGWDTIHTSNMSDIFDVTNSLYHLTLGNRTYIRSGKSSGLGNSKYSDAYFVNGDQSLTARQLEDGNSHSGDWQEDQFSQDFHNKQSNGQVTQSGMWGDAPYYIDNQDNMYVGAGHLQGGLYNAIGPSSAGHIRTLNFTDPVQAPQDSSFLLSTSSNWASKSTVLNQINGLDKLDMSQATNLNGIFFSDMGLTNLDLSNWNIDNAKYAAFAFWNDVGLRYLNLSSWDTSNMNSMADTFDVTVNLYHLVLGNKTYIRSNRFSGFSGSKNSNVSFSNGQQFLNSKQLEDGNSHPGDWQESQFSQNFLNAQQNHWQTGDWGTAPYYINPNDNSMHVGSGHLLSNLANNIGNGAASSISSINFDEPVTAPQDSSFLLSTSNLGVTNNSNLATINGLSNIDTSQATNMDDVFSSDTRLNNLDLSSWNVSNVKSMAFAFYNNFGLTNLNVNDWNTSNVNNMFSTFSGDLQLPNLDVSRWNTSNVSNMSYTFYNDWALHDINLANWSSSNVQNMGAMFLYDSINNLTLGNQMRLKNEANLLQNSWQSNDSSLNSTELEDGNSHSGNWQKDQFSNDFSAKQSQGQVTQSGYWGDAQYYIDNQNNMYVGTGHLQGGLYNAIGSNSAGHIRTLNFTDSVKAPQDSSFLLSTSTNWASKSTVLNQINGLDKLDMSQATNLNGIFFSDMGLTNLDLSNWNIDNAKYAAFAFWNDVGLRYLNLSSWDTSNMNSMADTFDVTVNLYHLVLGNKTYLRSNNFSGFSGSKNNNVSFSNGQRILTSKQLEDGNSHPGDWQESQFSQKFLNAQQNRWQTGDWGTAPYYIDPSDDSMHVGTGHLLSNLANNIGNGAASSISSINFDEPVTAPQDSSFLLSTSNLGITNNSNLATINGLSNIDTSQATNMDDIFSSDTKLNNLDLSSWNVSNVRSLGFAFYNNWALTNLNVSHWNTNNLNNLFSTFSGAGQLANLDVSHWNTSNVSNMSDTFYNDWALNNINLANWSSNNAQTMSGMFQYDNINDLTLGNQMKLKNKANLLQNSWQSNGSSLNSIELEDGHSHPGNWQEDQFSQEFHEKQRSGQVLQSGMWGDAPYYIDKQDNMYVGTGHLSSYLHDVIGATSASQIQSINFEEPVQAPYDSSFLLSTSDRGIMGVTNLQKINGLDKLDMSQVASVNNIFSNDTKLTDLDLSSWNVSNIKDLSFAFWNNHSLKYLNLSNWDTSNSHNMNDTFDVTSNLYHIILGDKTYIKNGEYSGLSNSKDMNFSYSNGSQTLNARHLESGDSHPGDWQESQFTKDFFSAQRNHWQTGDWGTAPYYINPNDNSMQVGSGELQSNLVNNIGTEAASSIRSINFDGAASAPANSSFLLSTSNWRTINNSNLTMINGLNNLDMSQATNIDNMFSSDMNLNNLDLSSWNVSNVNSMGFAFYNDQSLTNLNISNWDTSNVNNMFSLFSRDYQLSNLNISHWNTLNVSNMSNTFYDDYKLNNLDLSNWSSNNAQTMSGMLQNDNSITNFTLGNQIKLKGDTGLLQSSWQNGDQFLTTPHMEDGNSHPNQWHINHFLDSALQNNWYIGYWGSAPYYIDNSGNMHVGPGKLNGTLSYLISSNHNQTIHSLTFDQTSKAPQDSGWLLSGLNNQDIDLHSINGLNNLDTSQVTSVHGLFAENPSLNQVDANDLNTQNVHDFSFTFWDTALTNLNLSSWNTQDANDMEFMFKSDNKLSHLNVNDWNTSNVDDLYNIFADDPVLTDMNLNNWDTHNVKNIAFAFNNDKSLQSLNISNWNTSNVNDAEWTLSNLSSLANLDVSHWNTTNISNMHAMFARDPILNHLNVSDWNLQSAQDLSFEFWDDSSLNDLDLSNRSAPNATDMEWMFKDDSSLQNLSVDGLDTPKLNNLGYTFSGDSSLTSLNLSNWDTHNVNSLDFTFSDDKALRYLNTSDWNTSNVKSANWTFNDLQNIQSLDLNNWNVSNIANMHAMFAQDPVLNNLNVSDWNPQNVQDLSFDFWGDSNLSYLNLHDWNTTHANNMEWMLRGDYSLRGFDLSDLDTSNANLANFTTGDYSLNDLTLGDRANLKNSYVPGIEWQNQSHYLNIYQFDNGQTHPGTWQRTPFSYEYDDAQRAGGQTGFWGSAPYYTNRDQSAHVGAGQLQGTMQSTLNNPSLASLNFEEPVQAPKDSSNLLAATPNSLNTYNTNMTNISGLDKLDTSQTTNMSHMLAGDSALTNADGANDWDIGNVDDMSNMFAMDANLQHLDISNWDTTHIANMNGFLQSTNGMQSITLGDRTRLLANSSLIAGLWQNGTNNFAPNQLMDDQAHAGTWYHINVQNGGDLVGTTDDNLANLIERNNHLPMGSGRVQIIHDQGSQDNDHLRPGNYDNVTYGISGNDGNFTYYQSHLAAYAYTQGDDLLGKDNQSLNDLLDQHYGANVTVDDDGGSVAQGNMQTGHYTIKYHYQDSSGNQHYLRSNLQVSDDIDIKQPYLIVNDDVNAEMSNPNDVEQQLRNFFNMDGAKVDLTRVGSYDSFYYTISDNNHRYSGSVDIKAPYNEVEGMDNIPGASDTNFWNTNIVNEFNNVDTIDQASQDMTSYHTDSGNGTTTIQGNLTPASGQFINNPTIPYELQVIPSNSDYSVNNTVDDQQVQDVIHSLSDDAHVIAITDGAGNNVTSSLGQLSSIANNNNVTIRLKANGSYINVHFAQISDLVEPNIDITHNSATDGSDISNDELQSQIQSQTHESSLRDFGIDNTTQVSSNVKQINYHFTKDVVATGKSINVRTDNAQVTGTAYVHYLDEDTSNTPTYTVIQGNDPVQHIEDVTGHTITMNRTPAGQDINNLPIGTYNVAYQYSDVPDAENDTTYDAIVNVVPNYYFSPVTNDTNYQAPDNESGNFHAYDYQQNGNSYKSVKDTTDYTNGNSNNENSNSSNNNSDKTVDGLHTQDGKVAHFDGKTP